MRESEHDVRDSKTGLGALCFATECEKK